MNNILDKIHSHRTAVASAILTVSKQETIDAIQSKTVPKGDVFEFSRAAGLLAIKKTSDVIPDCHPLPIEHAKITHRIEGLHIHIEVEVATIYKTGVEVEAMHGASITALTMYDMLKPIDKHVEIQRIHLINKQGGKTAFNDLLNAEIKTAVIVCSDTINAGKKEDKGGMAIIEKLKQYEIQNSFYQIIPDEKQSIQNLLKELVHQEYDLVLFTGGTGLSPRDITPESVSELFDRDIPGIMEAARSYGQQRTPYAMLSRGVAGVIGSTFVVTLPGSTRGAIETMNALFPYLKHVFKVAQGMRHD
ncbi:MAG TPA: bifunctional molybdenum cofactor biosynthesis protein MoaC/MoaB [Chitinophagaceae bacterium]|nr:bifunctional molybdenum cofactor biosynthesis protein MoaC/MoaB [Chitinophagaceae bacterium]